MSLTIQALELDQVVPNPNNPRRITDKHPSLPSLADSLKATGQIQPIVVRPKGAKYEILAGERRWRAARIAELATIDAVVKDVDDQQAWTITVVENLQREDLHWLEESRGIAAMLEKEWSVDTIARELGKSVGWVHLRAKLGDLSPRWQKQAAEGEELGHWPVAMLELVARLPAATQDSLLSGGGWSLKRCDTVAKLRKHIDGEVLHLLSSAPMRELSKCRYLFGMRGG